MILVLTIIKITMIIITTAMIAVVLVTMQKQSL